MHEGADMENNREMEEYGPGRQRWRNQPEDQETYAEYYEEYNILGLKKSLCQYQKKIEYKTENYGRSKVILFKVTFLTYFFIMHL
jgi:hypothetical protein